MMWNASLPDEAQISMIVRGESNDLTALCAQNLGFRLTAELSTSAKRVFDAHMEDMIESLVNMLAEEDDLNYLDEYTFLLTGVRSMATQRRLANILILESTSRLLRPFKLGYERMPDGYTAPELVSMWSSILNEEGLVQCGPYMECLVSAVTPCVNSATVGSVVAALLIANLVGHRDDSADMFELALNKMVQALKSAFSGDTFAERKWGPGPVTKSFASLTASDVNKERVYKLNLVPLFGQIISKSVKSWQATVEGFDEKYYMGAKTSACKVIWNIATRHNVEEQCPEILNILQTFLKQKDLTTLARQNAECAAFRIACGRYTYRKQKMDTSKDGEKIPPSLVVLTHAGRSRIPKITKLAKNASCEPCNRAGPNTQLTAEGATAYISTLSADCPECETIMKYTQVTQVPLLNMQDPTSINDTELIASVAEASSISIETLNEIIKLLQR
eukprot:m.54108 g.54108  ORF g.54108 m.54108 type:complete len:448 (-) comp10900_c0_seq5:98-1441(-)